MASGEMPASYHYPLKPFYNSLCQERSYNFSRNGSINNPYKQRGKLPQHPFPGYNQRPRKKPTVTLLKAQHGIPSELVYSQATGFIPASR